MRIRHVLHSYRPLSHGGIETYVAAIADAQRASGDDVAIIAGTELHHAAEGDRSEIIDQIPLRRMKPPFHREPSGFDRETSNALRDMLRADPPDVLHVHHWHNLTSDIVRIARGLGIPVVLSLHDYFSTCPFFHRLDRRLHACEADTSFETCVACGVAFYGMTPSDGAFEMRTRDQHYGDEVRAAQRVLALSDASRDYLAQIPKIRDVPIIAEGLPRPILPAFARDDALRPKNFDLEIVSWGGLVPGKGFHLLLEAAAALGETSRVRVRHYGRIIDPEYLRRIEELAPKANASLLGMFDYPSMLAEVARADLAVFPSLFRETHGYVVDEAMMIGLPVVISDRGAPPERIGKRGLALPAGDVSALTRALRRFLDEPRLLAEMRAAEPPLRPTVAEHVRKLREHYVAVGAASSGR